MDHVFVAVRLLLAVVLSVSGGSKLADPAGARRAFIELGGPPSLAPAGAWLLPIAEIGTALTLLTDTFSAEGAVAAVALFTVFTLALAVAMARGSTADCHCFGQLGAAPLSWRTLIRTGVLAGLAGTLLIAGRGGASPGVTQWLAAATPTDVGAPVVLVTSISILAWMVAWTQASRRREADLMARMRALEHRLAPHPEAVGDAPTALAPDPGLPIGAAAPGVTPDQAPGRPTLFLFVSANCPPCGALAPDIASWTERLGDAARLRVASREDEDGKALAEAFRVRWTPAAVLVGGTGRIASPLRYGTEGVQELFAALSDALSNGAVDERALHRRLGSRLGTSAVGVGDPAPAVELVDAAGGRHAGFGGEDTLILFWDPACRYCQGMTDELKAHQAAPPAGAPGVIFVIPRDAAIARAPQAAFLSTSFFDPASVVAPLFGFRGTPAAVLVDRNGRIASTVAIGKDSVLSLLVPVPARLPMP